MATRRAHAHAMDSAIPLSIPKMPDGEILDTPVGAAVVVLANEAKDGRLSICGGAGLSRSANLPSGVQLARTLHERFSRVQGYECDKPADLLAVADAAARLPDGLAVVQRAALDAAPYDSAEPQLEHRLLSLLVAEGAVTLLLTNWDNCVERSRQGVEVIPAARDEHEADDLRGVFILKIHGCCTRPNRLLITSRQLGEETGAWTRVSFQGRLAESTMVFVGIGDVAGYARTRIVELAQWVDGARVRVVSPDIQRGWQQSAWREVIPSLPSERRIELTAAHFLDELAREWVMQLVTSLRASATGSLSIEAVARAFSRFTASQALEWLRRATVGARLGHSVVRDPNAESLLEGIGLMADARAPAGAEDPDDGEAPIRFLTDSAVLVCGTRVEAMICPPRQTPADIERAAADRARTYANRRGPKPEIEILAAASSIRGERPTVVPAVSVVDPDAPVDDVVAGSEHVRVNLTYVDDLLTAA